MLNLYFNLSEMLQVLQIFEVMLYADICSADMLS
jgi:hypothetical protein